MENQLIRTTMLYGQDNIDILQNKSVCIFGIGGVGSYVAESLARMGIGHLILVDHDQISVSNLNRQIMALHSNIGMYKVDVMKQRIHDINPTIQVTSYKEFYLPNQNQEYLFHNVDYVVDAIDTISAKISIIEYCNQNKIQVISSMGTGNKFNPSKLKITDIYKTSVCPLAKVMRRELKKRNIKKCKVVYSDEIPCTPTIIETNENGKITPSSGPFVPSSAGLLIAYQVINDLLTN